MIRRPEGTDDLRSDGASPQADIQDPAAVDALIDALTLEEKASLTVGRDFFNTQDIPRLRIPAVWLADGPNGLRKNTDPEPAFVSEPATCFPSASALGASWDVDLVREVAVAIAEEAHALGVQVVLAPGLNLKRSPLCGRNFEYYSEDPVLSGRLGSSFVDGLQGDGIGACLKHFVANENERARYTTESIVDERTLRELYLRPFEMCVANAAPWMVMAAFNRLNGTACAENRWLLSTVLTEEWGHRGVVVSDWFGVDDRVEALRAGLHLQMPHGPSAPAVVTAVEEGRLEQTVLDSLVRDLVTLALKTEAARRPDPGFDATAHHLLARRAAGDSIVLLKNDGDILPLAPDASIAIIGDIARVPRFQGGGSAHVEPLTVDRPYDEIVAGAPAGASIVFAPGYRSEDDETTEELLGEARAVAREVSLAVVFVGLPESFETEGDDRPDLALPPAHDRLVEAVVDVQPRVVVVVTSGAPVAMPWADRVPAIVQAWLGGQASGGAIADVLLGVVNPSGRLAETFPLRIADTAAYLTFPSRPQRVVPFGEGLFTGYRWHDAREIEPLFAFGHGLSYTAFAYEGMSVNAPGIGPSDKLDVAVTVRNTGARAGREVVQLYIHEQSPGGLRPLRELKAFAKVSLEPGEATIVRFTLESRDMAVFDPDAGGWVVREGDFDILVGSSSRKLPLSATVHVAGSGRPPRLDRESTFQEWLEHPAGRPLVDGILNGPEVLALGNTAEFPLWKLAVMGIVSEAGIDDLVAAASGGVSGGDGSGGGADAPRR
jgi:beta-glucosidase